MGRFTHLGTAYGSVRNRLYLWQHKGQETLRYSVGIQFEPKLCREIQATVQERPQTQRPRGWRLVPCSSLVACHCIVVPRWSRFVWTAACHFSRQLMCFRDLTSPMHARMKSAIHVKTLAILRTCAHEWTELLLHAAYSFPECLTPELASTRSTIHTVKSRSLWCRRRQQQFSAFQKSPPERLLVPSALHFTCGVPPSLSRNTGNLANHVSVFAKSCTFLEYACLGNARTLRSRAISGYRRPSVNM